MAALLGATGVGDSSARVLDLGCGGGEWLVRGLTANPHLRAEGVDLAEAALAHARTEADRLTVGDRLVLHRADAAEFRSEHPFDLVLSVGSSHAFGGLIPTLTAARKHLAPGGRVLIGDGFWAGPPGPDAVEMLGDFADLATTVRLIEADGWAPVAGHISTRAELDDYEWAWTGSLTSWALDHPQDPDRDQALQAAATHRSEWLEVYRECFGFLTLVLRATG